MWSCCVQFCHFRRRNAKLKKLLASFAILLFLSRCEMLVSEPWCKERSWHLCIGREGYNQQLSSGAIQHSRNNDELKTKIRSCYKLTWLWLCPHSYIGKSLTRGEVMVESKTSRDLCFYPEVANLRTERKRKKKKERSWKLKKEREKKWNKDRKSQIPPHACKNRVSYLKPKNWFIEEVWNEE